MGWARAAVGTGMALAPGAFLRLSGREAPTPVSVLLMRTIGIRDLVLGAGTIAAARRGNDEELTHWTSAGLASDSLDVLASVAARQSIGRSESTAAAAAALVFAVGDLVVLRRRPEVLDPSPAVPGSA